MQFQSGCNPFQSMLNAYEAMFGSSKYSRVDEFKKEVHKLKGDKKKKVLFTPEHTAVYLFRIYCNFVYVYLLFLSIIILFNVKFLILYIFLHAKNQHFEIVQ